MCNLKDFPMTLTVTLLLIMARVLSGQAEAVESDTQIIIFDPKHGSTNAPCTTTQPCKNFQDALDATKDNDTLLIRGSAQELKSLPCSSTGNGFVIMTSITIQPEMPDVIADFDCLNKGRMLLADGGNRGEESPLEIRLYHLRIRNGFSSSGAGIFLNETSVVMEDLHFENCNATGNSGEGRGAAVYSAITRSHPNIEMIINSSSFVNLVSSISGGAVYLGNLGGNLSDIEFEILNNQFENCRSLQTTVGSDGGAVYFEGGQGDYFFGYNFIRDSYWRLFNNTFTDCRTGRNGGAIAISVNSLYNSSMIFSRNYFRHCYASGASGAIDTLHYDTINVSMVIEDNSFLHCRSGWGGSGALGLYPWWGENKHNEYIVTNNSFKNCYTDWEGGGMLLAMPTIIDHCVVLITQNSFVNVSSKRRGGAISFYVTSDAGIVNSTLIFSNLEFSNVSSQESGGGCISGVVPATTDSSLVLSNIYATNISSQYGTLLQFTSGQIENGGVSVSNVTVSNSYAAISGGCMDFRIEDIRSIVLSQNQTAEPECKCTHESLDEGTQSGTLSISVQGMTVRNVSVDSPGFGGLLSATNCAIKLRNVDARNIWAKLAGSLVYVDGSSSLDIQNVYTSTGQEGIGGIIAHESNGALTIYNLTGTTESPKDEEIANAVLSVLRADSISIEESVLKCSKNRRITEDSRVSVTVPRLMTLQVPFSTACSPCPSRDFIQVGYNRIRVTCSACRSGAYLLGEGQLVNTGTVNDECYDCPFGATCSGFTIPEALPRYWGMVSKHDSQKVMSLVQCPFGYCCSPSDHGRVSSCPSFDSCAPLREGIGCGRCVSGASEQIGGSGCISNEECDKGVHTAMWIGMFIFLIIASVVIIGISHKSDKPASTAGSKMKWLSLLERVNRTFGPIFDSTIVYYQLVGIVVIADPEARHEWTDTLMRVLPQLFNLSSPTPTGWCLFKGLTSPGVYGITIARAFILLSLVILIGVIHWLLWKKLSSCRCSFKCWCRYSLQTYLLAFSRMAILMYTSLGEASATLIRCNYVPEHGLRINIDMTRVCASTWWWWGGFFWFTTSTVLVPFAVWRGIPLLSQNRIGSVQYALAQIFPLPYLLRWSCKFGIQLDRPVTGKVPKVHRKTLVQTNECIVQRETGGFKPRHGRWQAVLIARRLALITVLLIPEIYIRSLANVIVCMFSLAAQFIRKPYEHKLGNFIEMVNVVCLSVLAILSSGHARFISVGRSAGQSWHQTLSTSVQSIALFLPAAVVIISFIYLLRTETIAQKVERYEEWSSAPAEKTHQWLNPVTEVKRTQKQKIIEITDIPAARQRRSESQADS